MATSESLGQRIKELRGALEMSQVDLAVAADVSLSVVSQIEQGRTTDPRAKTVKRLARALSVPAAELLDLIDEKES